MNHPVSIVLVAAALTAACDAQPQCSRVDGQMCTAGDASSPDASDVVSVDLDAGADAAADAAAGDADSQEAGPQDAADAMVEAGPPPCDPAKDPSRGGCVDDANGVFVAPNGSLSAAGTKADPMATVAAALAQAATSGKSRVFICAGTYGEALSLDDTSDGISLYGGLDCLHGWRWTGASTAFAPGAPGYALRVSGTASMALEDLSFTAADAVGQDASGAGQSSIAALIQGATVTLSRVTIAAGRGADGAPGDSGSLAPNYVSAPPVGGAANSIPGQAAPGAGAAYACPLFGTSKGGDGASLVIDPSSAPHAIVFEALPGSPGTASPAALPAPPLDGLGTIGPGDQGADGAGATAGGGAAASYGTLSSSFVWQPSSGTDGAPGNPGQGGAGGGSHSDGTPGNGGSAGGCGGAGGKGGHGGGASIALLSIQSTTVLSDCVLETAGGGSGGAGGAGQDGQPGALATSTPPAFAGGAGGAGGGGAGGGGGTGGLSVAIAYRGNAPVNNTALPTTMPSALGTAGSPGDGGPGGRGASAALAGASGSKGRPGLSSSLLAL